MSSDRRREHAPEVRARLVAEMMADGSVSAISRRAGICTSVLHRWHRRARRESGLPVASAAARLLPVRVAAPEAARPTAPAAPVLEVVLGNGRVLRVPPGADPVAVAGLARQVQAVFGADPFSGHLFVFRGRRGDLVKVLWWDTQGLVLYAKRLERGKFVWPQAKDSAVSLTPAQLSMLLEGIDRRMPARSWRPEMAG